jgi:hypothetical protein
LLFTIAFIQENDISLTHNLKSWAVGLCRDGAGFCAKYIISCKVRHFVLFTRTVVGQLMADWEGDIVGRVCSRAKDDEGARTREFCEKYGF